VDSTWTQRRKVLSCFILHAVLHTVITVAPFTVVAVFAVGTRLPDAEGARWIALIAAIWALTTSVKIAVDEFKSSVSHYMDLVRIPVTLAKLEMGFRYRCLWPHTLLVACGFLAVLLVSTEPIVYALGTFLMIAATDSTGKWLQRVLIRLVGPSAQERYSRVSEAMESGARTIAPSPVDSTGVEVKRPIYEHPPV